MAKLLFHHGLGGVFLSLVALQLASCQGGPTDSGNGEDKVTETVGPTGATLRLESGAYLAIPPGALTAPATISLETIPAEEGSRSAGPAIRLSIQGSGLGNVTPAAAAAPLTACVPVSGTSLSTPVTNHDVLIRSGDVFSYALSTTIGQGSCLEFELPPGNYEAEFEAILVDRAGNSCDSYKLIPHPGNQPSRTKAIILLHGWQTDKSTCRDFLTWSETDVTQSWDRLVQSVVLCSQPQCQLIEDNFNIFYYKYPSTLIEPSEAAAHLRVELNRALQDPASANSFSEIVLVGHSMGGLVARYFNQVNRFSDIQKVITLGTPHLGIYRTSMVAGGALEFLGSHYLIGDPLPDTEGVRSMAWSSSFMDALEVGDIQNRRDIYTLAGDVSHSGLFGEGVYGPLHSLVQFIGDWHATFFGRDTLDGSSSDGIVTVKSALLNGAFRPEERLLGYNHEEMKAGNGPQTEDPLFVRVRSILADFTRLGKSIEGRLVRGSIPQADWVAVLVVVPDTAFFLNRLLREAPVSSQTTGPDGSFRFTGLEEGLDYAVILENPAWESGFRPDEFAHVYIEEFDLAAGEELVFPSVDVRYNNPSSFEDFRSFNYGLPNPGSLSFTWSPYTRVVNPQYWIHLHRRDGDLFRCWASPVTFNTTAEFNLRCNSERLSGTTAGPGPYYWYVIVRHPDVIRQEITGFSFSGRITLRDSRFSISPSLEPAMQRNVLMPPMVSDD